MALTWPYKDPDEILDYELDWASRLPEGDTISTSTWIITGTGLVKDSDSHGDDSTTVWLSAGTLGTKYVLTNRVVTTGGRTMDQSVNLSVKAK